MRLYANTDEIDLNALYYSGRMHIRNDQTYNTISDMDSWKAFKRFCMKSLRGFLNK